MHILSQEHHFGVVSDYSWLFVAKVLKWSSKDKQCPKTNDNTGGLSVNI